MRWLTIMCTVSSDILTHNTHTALCACMVWAVILHSACLLYIVSPVVELLQPGVGPNVTVNWCGSHWPEVYLYGHGNQYTGNPARLRACIRSRWYCWEYWTAPPKLSFEMETGTWPFSCSRPDTFPFTCPRLCFRLFPDQTSHQLGLRLKAPSLFSAFKSHPGIESAAITFHVCVLLSNSHGTTSKMAQPSAPLLSICKMIYVFITMSGVTCGVLFILSYTFLFPTIYFQWLLSCLRNFGRMFLVGIKHRLHICAIHLAGNERWGERVNIYM